MALWGYLQGLVVSALSLAGFALGAFVGSRLGAAAARPGLELAVRAALQPRDGADGRRRSRRSCSRRWERGSGGGCSFPLADVARRRRRRGAGRDARPRRWSGSRARSRSRLRARASTARTSSARRSSRKLNEVLPPSGPILNALARVDPFPQHPRARGRRARRRTGASCATPTCAPRTRASCGCSARACGLAVQGSGWVASPGRRGDERARGRGRGRHDRRGRRRRRASTRRRSPSTRTTTSRCCACRASARRPLASARARRRASRSRSSAIRRTVPTAPAGPARRDPHRDQPGRLRRGPGAAADDLAARHDPVGQLGRPGGRRRRAVVATVFAATTIGPAGRLRRPAGHRARRPCDRAERPVDTGPCVR